MIFSLTNTSAGGGLNKACGFSTRRQRGTTRFTPQPQPAGSAIDLNSWRINWVCVSPL